MGRDAEVLLLVVAADAEWLVVAVWSFRDPRPEIKY